MRALAPVLLVSVLCGCAHSHFLAANALPDSAQHFNRAARGAEVAVHRTSGEVVIALKPRISDGAILWYDTTAGRRSRLPLSDIRELRFKDAHRGFVDGLRLGALPGLAIGSYFFFALRGVCQGGPCSAASRMPALVLFGTPPVLIGGLVGAQLGSERFVVTRPQEP